MRREGTDRLLITGERHRRIVLARYVTHYNTRRPHQALHLTQPRPDHPNAHASPTHIRRQPTLGGLINEYQLVAA
ncbi:integrase core domain-containing protein [Kibdelosporangium aridum]|uniref:integrase core domain-containing protein n=1 Tax=Kibdelosporangium aridum TaxID=2030 RepID=UPI0035E6D365